VNTAVQAVREVAAGDIRWNPFAEPVNWFEGVDPDDGLGGIVARLLLIRRGDADVMSGALERLHEQHIEVGRQQRVIVRLHEERKAGLKTTAADDQVLRDGPTFKFSAVRLANELENLGVAMMVDAEGRLWTHPPVPKDSRWAEQIRRHRDDLVAIVRYCARLPR
jgi:hypothetical protein